MGFFDFLKKALTPSADAEQSARPAGVRTVDELAARLGLTTDALRAVSPQYTEYTIPKKSGGKRKICAPAAPLKAVQKTINCRLLARAKRHPAASGFERKQSIVTNAVRHMGRAVVVRMDLKDFFPSIRADRIKKYFGAIGWNADAAALLTHICTYNGGLPQGAPTSPALSNLVNYRLDNRLQKLADVTKATYTRYADDLTFSFAADDRERIATTINCVKAVVEAEGYQLHMKRKLHVRRRHQRQVVTGLVVNAGVRLPRETRRWLRAVEHRAAKGGNVTLTPEQLHGWRALQKMVAKQAPPAA
jgi:RNA-directed DNA polymerase